MKIDKIDEVVGRLNALSGQMADALWDLEAAQDCDRHEAAQAAQMKIDKLSKQQERLEAELERLSK